jgi:hypothetical protein
VVRGRRPEDTYRHATMHNLGREPEEPPRVHPADRVDDVWPTNA